MILALLTALNLINYLDRFLVVAVGPGSRTSLAPRATGSSVRSTTAFMLGYFVTSPIFGWLGDRYPRKWLIAAGVAIWSVATVASGLAHEFYAMIAARIVVGVGEASYATLSPTIIDDIATAKNRNRWLADLLRRHPGRFGARLRLRREARPPLRLALGVLHRRRAGLAARPRHLLDRRSESAGASAATKAPGLAVYVDLRGARVFRGTVARLCRTDFALGGFTDVGRAVPAPQALHAARGRRLRPSGRSP